MQSFWDIFTRNSRTTKSAVTSQPIIKIFVSNKSNYIGLSCNNTYFATTITSYAVEGGIVFLNPVYSYSIFSAIVLLCKSDSQFLRNIAKTTGFAFLKVTCMKSTY